MTPEDEASISGHGSDEPADPATADNAADGPDTGVRGRLERLSTWRADLTREAALLPNTLAELRETITDLRQVSARLEGATEGLEMALKRAESTGLAPMARRLDAMATDLESQLLDLKSQPPGSKLVTQAADDLQRTLDAFSTLFLKAPNSSED